MYVYAEVQHNRQSTSAISSDCSVSELPSRLERRQNFICLAAEHGGTNIPWQWCTVRSSTHGCQLHSTVIVSSLVLERASSSREAHVSNAETVTKQADLRSNVNTGSCYPKYSVLYL
jgi:hypothetical protein